MALLKLNIVLRATTSTGKEFQVDATVRANDPSLKSSEKRSRTILNDDHISETFQKLDNCDI